MADPKVDPESKQTYVIWTCPRCGKQLGMMTRLNEYKLCFTCKTPMEYKR